MLGFLPGSGWIKAAIGGLLALAVVSSVYAAYSHYTGLVDENAQLQVELANAKTALSLQEVTLDKQAEALEEWVRFREDLGTKLQELADGQREARREQERLNDLFAGHDFDRLLQARPGLILNRVNDGTDRIGRLFECATGADNPDCGDGADTSAVISVSPETGTD